MASKSKISMSSKIRSDMFGASSNLPRIIEIDLVKIDLNPNQPRKYFDEASLLDLASSIEKKGLLQPIILKSIGDDKYLLVAGERRFRAHQILGRQSIPAILTDGDTEEIALIENLQREELKPIETAEALEMLMKTHNYTHEDVANALGKARNTVTELLSLNRLPEYIRKECRISDKYSKSVLIELAKADEAILSSLWEDLKSGKKTVQDIRKGRSSKIESRDDNYFFTKTLRSLRNTISTLNSYHSKLTPNDYEELLSMRKELDQLISKANS